MLVYGVVKQSNTGKYSCHVINGIMLTGESHLYCRVVTTYLIRRCASRKKKLPDEIEETVFH